MFYGVNLSRNLLQAVALILNGSLSDDFSAIQRLIYIVNRSAENLHSILQSLLDGSCALKCREQRRVQVANMPTICPKQRLAHDTHITGKAD